MAYTRDVAVPHRKVIEMPGPTEWIIIGVVVILLFGAKKLPEMARALGKSSSEFKKGMKEGGADEDEKPSEPAKPADSSTDPDTTA